MVDVHSPRQALTIQLPADLIAELQLLAQEKQVSIDDVVMEACLGYTEPYTWERSYQEWLRTHSDERRGGYGIDGEDLYPPAAREG